MTFAPTQPLASRRRFKVRSFENMVVLIAIFVPLVMGISQFVSGVVPVLIGDALAIASIYYLYCIWKRRPIEVLCNNCNKVLLSNTPWVCGFCKEPNRNANEYPFVYQCGHCHDEPKAYLCHHCGDLVFLSDDQDKLNFAYCLNAPVCNEREERLNRKQAEKEEREHEISIAELELKLKTIVDRRDGPKIKPRGERMIAAFEDDFSAALGLKAHVAKRKAELAVELKDHPDLYKQACEVMDLLLNRHS